MEMTGAWLMAENGTLPAANASSDGVESWTGEPNIGIGCLWFLVIALMFFAQHHVCDAYFVPAINVFVDTMKKSKHKFLQRWGEEAVAGATICALGCNGPELFSNLIALYTGSDAGIGVVVGSEIFNLLIIVGCAVLATPSAALPLQLERFPFTRDCLFYFISIVLLYWALQDRKISWDEARILLAAAAVYVGAVYFTTDVKNCIFPPKAGAEVQDAEAKSGKMHGVEVQVEEILHSAMADAHGVVTHGFEMDATTAGIYASPLQKQGTDAGADEDRASIGFKFDNPNALLGPILRYKDLKEIQIMEFGVIQLEFYHNLQHVTLRITLKDPSQANEFLESIQSNSAQHTTRGVYVHTYDPTIFGAWAHFAHEMKSGSCIEKILAVPEFIIDAMLKSTLFLVDVKHISRQGRWPLCFVGAMFWLAMFSWAMLEVADEIHYNIPALPSSFLGITVCAVGTSFPNAVASIIMAQQNKPAAAIANALGSNVQNVFLAMALPWVIYCTTEKTDSISQNVAGINEGVVWMMGTLMLLLVIVLMPGMCSLTKCNGIFLCSVYVLYLVQIGGETFKFWQPMIN